MIVGLAHHLVATPLFPPPEALFASSLGPVLPTVNMVCIVMMGIEEGLSQYDTIGVLQPYPVVIPLVITLQTDHLQKRVNFIGLRV